GDARALQRQDDAAPVVTEAQAMAEIKADQDRPAVDETPEEAAAERINEPPIDESKVVAEAKAAQAESGGSEVEVPDFNVDAGECVTLWDEGPESEAPEKEEAPAGDESLYKYLLNLAASLGISGLTSIPERLAGLAAAAAWKTLPLSVRVAVINKAIDSS